MKIPRTGTQWESETDTATLAKCYRGSEWFPKLQQFAVACCRRSWDLIPEGLCRNAVEVAERYIDGEATKQELYAARSAAQRLWRDAQIITGKQRKTYRDKEPDRSVAKAAVSCTYLTEHSAIYTPASLLNVLFFAVKDREIKDGKSTDEADGIAKQAVQIEAAAQTMLLRELVGNPFVHADAASDRSVQ